MHILASLLLLLVNTEGTAVTGNPMRELTDEDEIKLVVARLERSLAEKDKMMISACLSENISIRKTNELSACFTEYVNEVFAPEGRPLVCLQSVSIKMNGKNAVVSFEAYSYGNNKRIKAVYRMPFKKSDDQWKISDAEPVNTLLKQIGGIAPVQDKSYEEIDNTGTSTEEKKKEKIKEPSTVIEGITTQNEESN
jgi:hypothetical protein